MRRQVHAIFSSLEGLHRVLRARAEEIQISREQIDRHAGLPDGYSSKLLAPKPIKKLSIEGLCKLAPALALDLALVVNPTYLIRIRSRSPVRDSSHAMHAGTVQIVFSRKFLRKIQRKGGLNSRAYMTRRQAKMLARKAANARWLRAKSQTKKRPQTGPRA